MTNNINNVPEDFNFWSLETVKQKVSLSTATIYRLINLGDFPKPVQISKNRVAFISTHVIDWMMNKAEEAV